MWIMSANKWIGARIASHATKLAEGHHNYKRLFFDGATPPFLLGKKCFWKKCKMLDSI